VDVGGAAHVAAWEDGVELDGALVVRDLDAAEGLVLLVRRVRSVSVAEPDDA
jgi:hypothetical protein